MQKLWRSVSLDNLENILKYGVAAILLVIPLYQKFPVFSLPGSYVAVRAEDFLLTLLGLVWLVYLLKSNNIREIVQSKITKAIFLFFIAGFLSVLSGYFLTHTASLATEALHWGRRIEYILPFFIAYSISKVQNNTRFYLQTLFIACFLAFLYGFGQIHFNFPVISTQNEEYSKGIALRWIPGTRVHSTFAGHYDLSAFLVLVFPLALAYLFNIQDKLKRYLFIIVFYLPVYWLFLQTEARVSFVAYLVATSLTLWILRKRIFIIPLVALSLIGMVIWSNLGARYIRTIDVFKIKVIDRLNMHTGVVWAADELVTPPLPDAPIPPVEEDRSSAIRVKVEWPRALRAFVKNPLLGTGYSSITLATDNDYLRALGETGLLGLLAFLLIILRIFERLGLHLVKVPALTFSSSLVAGFCAGLIGLLLNAVFIDVFEASKVAIIFWTLAGITVGTISRTKQCEDV